MLRYLAFFLSFSFSFWGKFFLFLCVAFVFFNFSFSFFNGLKSFLGWIQVLCCDIIVVMLESARDRVNAIFLLSNVYLVCFCFFNCIGILLMGFQQETKKKKKKREKITKKMRKSRVKKSTLPPRCKMIPKKGGIIGERGCELM